VAHAASVTVVNNGPFDQIATIVTDFGGTVTQVGGGMPGTNLTQSGDFVGPVSSQSGVSVSIPGMQYLTTVNSFIDANGSEPGQGTSDAGPILGSPTDLTFTTPGAGGPDGGDGDGSLQLTWDPIDGSDVLSVSFAGPLSFNAGGAGTERDLIFFTNTASGGDISLEFLLGANSVFTLTSLMLPGGAAGSGSGGTILDLDDMTFDTLLLTAINTGSGTMTSVEIDAIGVVPVPPAVWLFGSALALLGWIRRRQTS
jgi:hypothetical protein